MDQYSELLCSTDYLDFLLENAEYALERGYNFKTRAGVFQAQEDRFLFSQFLDEVTV